MPTDFLSERSKALLANLGTQDLNRCPIRAAIVAIADDKWMLPVFLELARRGETRFGELLRSVPGIRTKAMTKAVRSLEKALLVSRVLVEGRPPGVAYELTTKGHNAIPILFALHEWYASGDAAAADTSAA